MPPNSSGALNPLVNISMRRAVPPSAGTTTPLALQRSEFEDFVNAYRPTLDVPRREPPEPPPLRTSDDSKVDFGRSIKKLMKRPQGSPSVKNNRKSGFQRTPTLVVPSSSHSDSERGLTADMRPISEKKHKRPLSANIETALIPSPPPLPTITISGHSTTSVPPLDLGRLSNPDVPQPQQSPVLAPASKKSIKVPKNNVPDDHLKVVQESALAPPTILTHVPLPAVIPNQVKKKVSIQEDNRRSGTEVCPDSHCLIISGNNIGRFLPPRHNPDPILSMRVVPIPERKYHVILEFEESPLPPPIQSTTSGLAVPIPDDPPTSREQMGLFSWIRESHVAATGMLLMNVEKITEFPFVTYLVVNGGRHDLAQKFQCVEGKPMSQSLRQLHFLAGYEETITISRPPPTTFPEKPDSNKTGYVISLYQVLPGDDGLKFEQNWVMWTGARQLYRTIPDYMGLKRISVHKSILPTQTIYYCVMCELSNVMDHLTDACVVIDHLRARCCGFTGIYRIIDAL